MGDHFYNDYKKTLKRKLGCSQRNTMFTLGPKYVAEKVIHALTSDRPKRRYLVTHPARAGSLMARILPDFAIDYFMKKEYFDVVESKYVFKKNIKEEKSIEKIGTETTMDQLINNKIFLLNEHKQDCSCEKCKLLMQEIRTLLNEKKNVITNK